MFNPNVHNIEEVRKALQAMDHRGLKSYTPSWTGSGGNPTYTSHTVRASYMTFGGWCWTNLTITMSNVNQGAGSYTFGLPITPEILGAGTYRTNGWGTIYDASTGDRWDLISEIVSTSNTFAILTHDGIIGAGKRTAAGATVPITLTTGDIIQITSVYPI